MKRTIVAGFAVAVAVSLTACSSVDTTRDWDPNFDFSQTSTYMWISSDSELDDITRNRVRAAANNAMQARGFTEVQSNASLALGYQVTTEQQQSATTTTTGWGGGYRWGWGGSMGMSTSQTRVNTWDVGTLVLALFDTDSQNLVWTGSASAKLQDNLNPEERQRRIQQAVDQMMDGFPPGG
jgi:hypothetical protein